MAQPFLDPWVLLFYENLCLYQQCHQPHHLQPHVPEVPGGLPERGCRGEQPASPPATTMQSKRPPLKMQTRKSEVAGPQKLCPHPSCRSHISAQSEGCSAAGQPLWASLCLHSLSLLTAGSCSHLPYPLWLAGPGEGQTSLLPMTLSFRSPGASFMKQDIRVSWVRWLKFKSGFHLDSSLTSSGSRGGEK